LANSAFDLVGVGLSIFVKGFKGRLHLMKLLPGGSLPIIVFMKDSIFLACPSPICCTLWPVPYRGFLRGTNKGISDQQQAIRMRRQNLAATQDILQKTVSLKLFAYSDISSLVESVKSEICALFH